MSYPNYLVASDVADPATFATYAQQRIGIPVPRGKDVAILRRQVRDFFEKNPRATWGTLGRLVDWAAAKHRRPAQSWTLLSLTRYAYAQGFLPELDPRNATPVSVPGDIEDQLAAALTVETDPWWRQMLGNAIGSGKVEVLSSWQSSRV